MSAPWWRNATPSTSTATASSYYLGGAEQSFPSRQPTALPGNISTAPLANTLFSDIHRGAKQSLDARWNHVAQLVSRRRQLKVNILGCSTTNGCGSDSPSSMRCDASKSWARLFHDFLHSSLQESMPDWQYGVETRVHAKNAVDVTYFSQCTATFVHEDADVVVVEWFANMFGVFRQGNETGVDVTLEAIRAAAPEAAIVFAVWLKDVTTAHMTPTIKFIHAVGKRQNSEVVDVPHLLHKIRAAAKIDFASWYARDKKGALDHHPNGAGHWLLAKATAAFVARRLSNATPASEAMQSVQRKVSHSKCYQTCFDTADRLPVHQPLQGNWSLVDEGGDKGIKKLGYTSHVVGEELQIDLVSWLKCANKTGQSFVRLGYLVSTRSGQGALSLSCRGNCDCRGLRGYLGDVSPFPVLQTDARLQSSKSASFLPGMLNESLTVTASTTFQVDWNIKRGDWCAIRAKHIHSRERGTASTSRVRIDSMSYLTKCSGPCSRPSVSS